MNIAYAAGLFDGEGYIRVARWKKPNSIHVRYQLIAGIGMTYLPVIQQLQQSFGGSVNQNRHDLRNKNARIVFTWHTASQTAAGFLKLVFPHLIVKREEVELALQLQANIDEYRYKLGHHHSLHPDRDRIFAYRQELADQILALKKRSYPPLVDSGPSEISGS